MGIISLVCGLLPAIMMRCHRYRWCVLHAFDVPLLFAHCRLPNAWVCEADALIVLNYARILEGSPREHRLWSWWELSSSRMEQKCDEQAATNHFFVISWAHIFREP